jgi:hypothetical protein
MPWWGWIVIGAILLGAELFAIDAQFYLIFVGVGALAVGLLGLLGMEFPAWGQWLLFAGLSLAFMVTLRRQLYEKMRGRAIGIQDSAIGGRIVIVEDLAPGNSCRAEYRGSTWTAINVGEESIPAGTEARIGSVEGLHLNVTMPSPSH